MEINLTSPAFEEGGMIPSKYTCDGQDISPPLKWDNVPDETVTIALVADDPDAPMGTWVHWVLFNLPPETREIKEGIAKDETLEDGSRQGLTDFGSTGYGGPCPPGGVHRYFFKIYALDMKIDIVSVIDKETLLREIQGHIIGQGQLMGKYQRK